MTFRYSVEQINFLRKGYKEMRIPELTRAFNIKFKTTRAEISLKAALKNRKITCGRSGHFGKGHVSWNKGTKGLVKPNSGNFKKGYIPPNRKSVGSERINVYGYVELKINEPNPYVEGQKTRWKAKHVVVWENAQGPVPENHIVIFKDGNRLNCVMDNLIMISREVNAYVNRNGYGDLTGELKITAINMARLVQKASSLEK